VERQVLVEKEGLPPFQSVRVFEAAARLGSFARASEELGISAGAVSQHIRILEEFARQPLFRRLGRGVELTDAGQAAFLHAGAAMSELLQAGRAMRISLRGRRISISAAPSFASKWLIPRLSAFQELHPDTEVRLSADMALVDFAGSTIDIAIRYGPGGYEGLHHERLMSESVVVVCSPRLLDSYQPVRSPADLVGAPLIHDDAPERDPSCPTWAMWFAARGLRHGDVERGLRFNQSGLAIEAAVAGKGLALAKRQLALRDLESGQLVAPLDENHAPLAFAYWLVWPRGRRFEPAQMAFLEWLRAETGAADVQLGAGI
jgi:LysR family glycine cleavage system transcriptional activator